MKILGELNITGITGNLISVFSGQTSRFALSVDGSAGLGTESPVKKLHLVDADDAPFRIENNPGDYVDFSAGTTGNIYIKSSASADGIDIGRNNNLTTNNGIAIGSDMTVGATSFSIGIGNNSTSNANNALVIGNNASNVGGQANVVVGGFASGASAGSSVVIGHLADSVVSQRGTVVGYGASANSNDGVVIGHSAVGYGTQGQFVAVGRLAGAGRHGVAIGYAASASTSSFLRSVAVGYQAEAIASTAVAIGFSSEASDVDAIAIGQTTYASNDHAIAIGAQSSAETQNTISIGERTKSNATGAIMIGYDDSVLGITNSTSSSVAFGWNQQSPTVLFAATADQYIGGSGDIGVGSFFSEGANPPEAKIHIQSEGSTNSTSSILIENSSDSEMFQIRDDGSWFLGENNTLAVGSGTWSESTVVVGRNNQQRNSTSVIVGSNNTEESGATRESVIIGYNNTRLDATAFGYATIVGNTSTATASGVAIGRDVEAGGGTAVGTGSDSTGGGTAFGGNATATGSLGTALGGAANANGFRCTAVGYTANASSGSYNVVLGYLVTANTANNGVTIGYNTENTVGAISIGASNDLSGAGSGGIAIGDAIVMSGGVGSIAIGAGAIVGGDDAIAIGANTKADAEGAIAIGFTDTSSYDMTNSTSRSVAFGWDTEDPTVLFAATADQYIGGSGNLGIGSAFAGGTTSPTHQLHVSGDTRFDVTTASTANAGAVSLPANPLGFITVNIQGNDVLLPYYAT